MENEDTMLLSVDDYIKKFSTPQAEDFSPVKAKSPMSRWRAKHNINTIGIDTSPEVIAEFKELCKQYNATQSEMLEALIRYFKS